MMGVDRRLKVVYNSPILREIVIRKRSLTNKVEKVLDKVCEKSVEFAL